MTDERRYGDTEVSRIFEAAATAPPARSTSAAPAQGLTLAELQAIGAEVGVAPDRIAQAALMVDRERTLVPARKWLGLPISAGRTIDLPRAPTDREWEMLMGELRQTFRARGKDRSAGGIREWTNSNLHACIEPTEQGYRLRMGTLKGNAAGIGMLGIGSLLTGVVVFGGILVSGTLGQDLLGPALLGSGGASALAFNALRLPAWKREREQQMDYIADRALAIIAPAKDQTES